MRVSRQQRTLCAFAMTGASRRGLRAFAAVALLMSGTGCSQGEPPSTHSPSNDTSVVQPNSPHEETDDPAPELAEAEAAFRTMTAENPDPVEWNAAYQKLTSIGAPALPVLLDGLKSDSQVSREMASSVLAEFGADAEPAADELLAALDDDSTFVRANLATALLQMPDYVDAAVPVFAQILTGEDPDLRRTAATNLQSVEPEKLRLIVPQLASALDDADRDVVLHLVQLLGHIGPEATAALPALKSLTTEGDEELQSAVAAAISRIDPDGSDNPSE